MHRRHFMTGSAALLAAPLWPAHGAPGTAEMDAAFNYAYTLYEFARATQRPGGPASAKLAPADRLNVIGHRRGLSDHTARNVTAPNNDTVYSSAFLELSGGPVELNVPTVPDRYFSVAFMNAFTDNFHYIGTRATRGLGGRFWVVGPDWQGSAPAGTTLIRSDTNDVWMLARILVTGPDDVAAASRVQDALTLVLHPGRGPNRAVRAATDDSGDGAKVLMAANEMLGRQRRLNGQGARAKQFARLGLRPGASDFAGLSQDLQRAWREAAPRGIKRLRDNFVGLPTTPTGWRGSGSNTGDFGDDDLQRATVALGGIAALGRAEAMYFTSVTDGGGRPLSPKNSYRISVPPSGVPVDAFWSVTMYAAEPDGRFFFVPNPISRFAIGDRSPGLVRREDGGIDILLAREQPPTAAGGNWLPMPDGPFRVSFRAYLPRPEMIRGEWSPPPLELIG
jgi:hypothetical protein